MSRRVSLPAADDLFRRTAADDPAVAGGDSGGAEASVRAVPDPPVTGGPDSDESTSEAAGRRKPSGRVRHDEKMTVYVTSDELLDLEHARLSLRRSHGLAVDRGRMVREAISLILADLEANGDDSALVRRLTQG